MYCPVSTYLGGLSSVLGRYEVADQFFGQAAASCERYGATFFLARNDQLWGAMFAERSSPGDHASAAALLSRSARTAEDHGYGAIARSAARSLENLRRTRTDQT
jgi:hypothetical protein